MSEPAVAKPVEGFYEAAACVHQTYTEGSTACVEQLNKALAREEKNGSQCSLNFDHFIHPQTGNFLTLWSLLCQGKIQDPKISPTGSAVKVP